MRSVSEGLAELLGETWWRIAERPRPWPAIPEHERATFRTMVAFAQAAGRRGERSEEELARALCAGFWKDSGVFRHWLHMGDLQREVFRLCARALKAASASRRAAA